MTRLYTPEMERALASSKHNPKVLALHSELAALDDLFIKLSEMVA